MGILTECPRGASIENVPISDCPENFGQVQKLVLQRVFESAGVKNSIADPTLLASWTPLLAAVDSTKVVQTPFIAAPVSEAGAEKTYGGGNETPNGIPIVIGSEPSTFTANILRAKQTTIKALKTYMGDYVGVYLVNEFGQIGCLADDPETPTAYLPIPIDSLFVGDKKLGGFDELDMNMIKFMLRPNITDNFVVVTPTDFNALTDLITP